MTCFDLSKEFVKSVSIKDRVFQDISLRIASLMKYSGSMLNFSDVAFGLFPSIVAWNKNKINKNHHSVKEYVSF